MYELKGKGLDLALSEMKRVVKVDGKVLIMEHAVPRRKLIKVLFSFSKEPDEPPTSP